MNVNLPHLTRGQTPLSRAAENGHGGVVKLLLERLDLKVNLADTRGKTPLSYAIDEDHDAVAS